VPGAISGYDALLKRFGTMGFKETFERAARIADEGWGLAERRHSDLRGAVNGLKNDPDSKATFLDGDQAPALYSIIRNPGLSKALRLIQAQGRDAFYKGDIATAIVNKMQANGGVMTKQDLAEFESEWIEPISTNYYGYDVFEIPPPGQGFAALEMLNILEVCVPKLNMNLAALGHPIRCTGTCWSKPRSSPIRICWRRMPIRNSPPCRWRSCCRRPTRRRCAARSIPTWPRSRR
jgi:gamma-glutamyltranspeptidase/glutathione hydrolase